MSAYNTLHISLWLSWFSDFGYSYSLWWYAVRQSKIGVSQSSRKPLRNMQFFVSEHKKNEILTKQIINEK
jgi:hypothetical protein